MIVLFGLGVGLGLCMILWSWRTHRDRAIDLTLDHFRVDVRDLAVCDRDPRSVAVERLLVAVAGVALPVVMYIVTSMGGAPCPPGCASSGRPLVLSPASSFRCGSCATGLA